MRRIGQNQNPTQRALLVIGGLKLRLDSRIIHDIKQLVIITWQPDDIHRENHLRAGGNGTTHLVGIYQKIVIHIHHHRFGPAVNHHLGRSSVGIGRDYHLIALPDAKPAQCEFQPGRGGIDTYNMLNITIFR